MGAAYSEDLRRCIIKASEQSKQSVRELAKRFEVGKTFVNNLLNRYKKTGNLTALPHGGGEKPQLNLIEILWRFIKYEWLPLSAYKCWQSLVDFVEKVLREFGENYVINFV